MNALGLIQVGKELNTRRHFFFNFFILRSHIVNFAVVPPEITEISNDQTKNEGDVLTLKCTACGVPTPKIVWTRVADNSVVTFPLTISGKQDEGVYKCTAESGPGNVATRSVNVFVQSESVSL